MSQICTTQTYSPAPRVPGRSGARFVQALERNLAAAVDTLLAWQRRRRDRLHLMSLDDHMLHDIGISLADVEREASKPFWRP